jgi:septal ring factor EnvC (AmiA/AmiB activator)
LLFGVYCLLFSPGISSAESAKEEYKRIQKDIKKHKKKLEKTEKVEQSVLEELRKTSAELKGIESHLSVQRKKIKELQNTITLLQKEIDDKKESLQTQSNLLKKRLRILQRFSRERDVLLIIIAKEDTSEALRVMRYLRDISAYDYELINKFKEDLGILNEKQIEIQKLFTVRKSEEEKLIRLETSAKEKKRTKETLLVKVRKEKGIYEKMIADLKESSNRLLKIIQESERKEKGTRKKGITKVTPKRKEELPEDSAFTKLKGRLPWPVNGSVAIQYGTQVDPIFNLPVFRSGLHIKTSFGTPVAAIYDGKVVYADNFKGYGQLVIVNHGSGYHSLYGNLSKIFSKNGAIIKENQTLGEVGESSTLGTSGLYFEIRYRGKPLDPQQWLKR